MLTIYFWFFSPPSDEYTQYTIIIIIYIYIIRVFRVSFGSSKGSMVETLIYDSPPVQEETPDPDDFDDADG